jgi:hypothetical protein
LPSGTAAATPATEREISLLTMVMVDAWVGASRVADTAANAEQQQSAGLARGGSLITA